MFVKVFRQMYDGTLTARGPWQALVVFQQLLILADREGVVDMTPEAIARTTTIPVEVVNIGLEALAKDDPDSRRANDDGRRIRLLDDHRNWGWQIVNFSYYQDLISAEQRRTYHRHYQQERRSNRKGKPVDIVDKPVPLTMSTQEEVEAEEEVKKPPVRKKTPHGEWFAKFWETWPAGVHKVGKKPCAEKWKRENLDDIAKQIVDRVAFMARTVQWTRDGGQFAPMPITWLNQRRWEDGLPTDVAEETYL